MMVNKPAFSVCSNDCIVAFVISLRFNTAKIQKFSESLLYKVSFFRKKAQKARQSCRAFFLVFLFRFENADIQGFQIAKSKGLRYY